jgi:hypothetical protein
MGVRLRRADRCLDDLDVLRLEHGVEGLGVLAVAVSDEEAGLRPVPLGVVQKPYLNRSWNVRVEGVSRRGDLRVVRA